MKILFIRVDRIGDLICTLPVDSIPALKSADIHWLINKGLGFIMEHRESSRRPYTEINFEYTADRFKKLVSDIKKLKPDIAVVFHAPPWVSYAVWKARVPIRIGTLSQWYSFFLFNRVARQKRSQSIYHESEYNHQLVCRGLNIPYDKNELPYCLLRPSVTKDILKKWKLSEKGFYVIHPGMGGSAENWPTIHYAELINRITENELVVITGTSADQDYIEPLKEELGLNPMVIWLNEELSVLELLTVLSSAKAVLAPSTGVVHLAASLGVPTVGLYGSLKTQTSVRWGPRGPKVKILNPPQPTGEWGDMIQITVDQVQQTIQELIV